MKKTISLLLSLVILFSISTGIDLSAYAETIGDYEYYILEDDTAEITKYNGDGGDVSIPSTLDGYTVTRINSFAFDNCISLISVIIPNNIVWIRHDAFWMCENLVSITIPDSLMTIGDCAFEYCKSLTDVYYSSVIDDWNKISIGNRNLELIDATIHCTDGVINQLSGDYKYTVLNDNYIRIVHYNGTDSDIIIPETLDSYIVKEIGEEAFCELTEDGAYGYDFITSVYIPDSVETIYRWAFVRCKNLKSVRLSVNLKNLYTGVFSHCCSLNDIVLPENLEYIDRDCFSCCEDLTSINIPKNVNYIGGWAFEYCLNLSDVYYGGNKEDWKILIGNYNEYLLNATIHCKDGILNKKHVHSYKTVTTKANATTSKNGSIVTKCSVCGAKKPNTTIYYPKTITLSTTSYTYNGKVKTPSVTVKDSKGKTLKKNTDYTVTYAKGRKSVGKYSVTIKFKGNYSGTVTKTFTIKPKGTSISKVTAGKKKFTVKWKKQATQTTGYQIQYSTSSKFTSKTTKTVTISKNKTTSKTISKLTAKKKYYVRVRTYKTVKVNGKNTKLYSSWSKATAVTTKK